LAEFPIFEKSDINGPNTCEVYKFLRSTTPELYDEENETVMEVPWNFAKFILDGSTGKVTSYHNPRVSPLSLRPLIEKLLSNDNSTKEKTAPA